MTRGDVYRAQRSVETGERSAQAVALAALGKSVSDIAAQLGVRAQTVSRYLETARQRESRTPPGTKTGTSPGTGEQHGLGAIIGRDVTDHERGVLEQALKDQRKRDRAALGGTRKLEDRNGSG